MESEILSEQVKWECRRVADAFGVLTFGAVRPIKFKGRRLDDIPVTWEVDDDFDDVLPFKAVRPIKFEGKRLDGVLVTWELDEGEQLVSVMISADGYACRVELQCEDYKAGEWVCGVYKPLADIMAQGLTALGFDEDVIGVFRPKMSHQEAQAWFERLTRIWVPEPLRTGEGNFGPSWEFDLGQFHFRGFVGDQVELWMKFKKKGYFFSLTRESLTGEIVYWCEGNEEPRSTTTGTLYVGEDGHISSGVSAPPEEEELYAQFADEWMPFFRRGCWLSGVPIEASAHEKAEWTKGFTREELELWNLKF